MKVIETISNFIFIVAFILMLVAFFKPSAVAFWSKDKPNAKKRNVVLAYFLICIVSFSVLGFTVINDKDAEIGANKLRREEKIKNDSIAKIEAAEKVKADSSDKLKARTEEIEKSFSGWDGSHTGLVKYVKNNLNDADSFEHVETKYFDLGDYLIVNMRYRAKNAFGAKVLGFIKAKVDLNGNVLEIITSK
jgi:uncharacterized protein YhaN